MALPASNGDPAGMSTSSVSRNDRVSARGFRLPVAGAAVLGLSLLLSVGPALGAGNNNGNGGNGNGSNGGGNGTSGNVKVHDAATGLETSGSDNEPQVCEFWLGFTSDAPFEAGTWVVVSWAPTGDGSTVVAGVYDTSGDGVDSSNIIEVPAGHYRVEWAATGATVSKKKTFWVDAACDETVTPVDESPVEEPASPTEESEAEDPASPVEEPALPVDESPTEESPAEESVPAEEDESPAEEDESPAEAPALVEEELSVEEGESPAEESVLAGDGSAAGDPGTQSDDSPAEEPWSQVEEPATKDPGTPSDESPAAPGDTSVEEEAAQAVDPGSTDPGNPPTQDQLDGTAEPAEPTMSDTATPKLPMPSGLLAILGVLMLILVHAAPRREMRTDTHA